MNANLLKSKIVLKGLNVDKLLELMEANGSKMSRTAYFRKLNGTSEFDQSEIKAIVKALGIPKEEIIPIFFD